MEYNPSRSTWLNPNIEYLFNDEIIEYDMQDAGFNLIKQFKLLPKEKIDELERLEKGLERHKAVGILQRDDKVFSKALLDKFAEMRMIFINTNKLTDSKIISVKKDALFIIGQCNRTKFGGITFAPKNHYSSYIRFPDINNLEIYYSNDVIDIKGMSDTAVNRHRLYMLEFMRTVIPMIENKDIKIKRWINKFIRQYKDRELDEGYYLEFNNLSRDINPIFNYQKVIIPFVQIIMKEIY